MKRIISILLCATLLLSAIGALAASSTDCRHRFKVIGRTEPTCDEPGKTIRKCYLCGHKDVVIGANALGHDWEWFTDREASCLEEGLVHGQCRRCGASGYSKLPRLAHEWSDRTDKYGLTVSTCALCGMTRRKGGTESPLTLIGRVDEENNAVELWIANDGSTDLRNVGITVSGADGTMPEEPVLDMDTLSAGGSARADFELPDGEGGYAFTASALTEGGETVSSVFELYGVGGGDPDEYAELLISFVKRVGPFDEIKPGARVYFDVGIVNEGTLPLENAGARAYVHGEKAGDNSYNQNSSLPYSGYEMTYHYYYELDEQDVKNGYIEVYVHADGTVSEKDVYGEWSGKKVIANSVTDRFYFNVKDTDDVPLTGEIVITGVEHSGTLLVSGDVVTFTVSVRNTTAETMHNVRVTDGTGKAVSRSAPVDIDPNGTEDVTLEFEMSEAYIGLQSLSFEFTAFGVSDKNGTVSSQTRKYTIGLDGPAMSISAKAEGNQPFGVGDKFTVEVTVENTGKLDLKDLEIFVTERTVDGSPVTCIKEGAKKLAAGEKTVYRYEMTYTEEDEKAANYAAGFEAMALTTDTEIPVFADYELEIIKVKMNISTETVAVTGSVTVDDGDDGMNFGGDTGKWVDLGDYVAVVIGLDITMDLSASAGPFSKGDKVDIQVKLTNTGSSDIESTGITVSPADLASTDAGWKVYAAHGLKVNESVTYVYTVTINDADAGALSAKRAFSASATAGVTTCADKGSVSLPVIVPEEGTVTIVKKEDGHSLDPEGYHVKDDVHYLITVTNGTKETLDITLYDILVPGSGELCKLSGVTPGESRTVPFTYTVPEKTAGMLLANQAAAEWTDPAAGETKQAVSNVVNVKIYKPVVPEEGGPVLTKEVITTPTHGSDPGYYVLNDKVTYRVTLQNATGETWYNATVTDELYSTQQALFTVGVLAPGEEYSGTYDVFVQQPDVDQGKIVNTAHVEYENGDDDLFTDCSNTIIVYTGEETRGAGDTCVRTVVALEGEDTGYRVDYCAEHGVVYEQYRVRKENAATEAELIRALEDERSAWMGEIDELYEEMISGTKGKARSALKAERSAFEEDIVSYEALLNVLMPDDRAGVLEEIDRVLSDRCADLCYELHTAPEERKDVAYAEEMSSAEARNELDSAMAELWLAAAGSDKGIVADARAKTGTWLDARGLELEYLYPDDTGTVDGVILREAGSRAAVLAGIAGKQ